MNKTKDGIKRMLKEQCEKACNGYLVELLRMWELDAHYGYWIGEEVGGVYDYGGTFTIGMDDIIYCVEHDVTQQQYMAWQDYICEAAEFGFDTPNLRSWHRGCPRTPPEVFERLRGIKADLAKAVEEEKERVKNEKRENVHCVVQIPDNEVDSITSIEEYVRECFHKHPERIRYEKK